MNVLVVGAGGLVGSSVVPALRQAGHSVVRAVRRPPRANDEVQWTPATGELAPHRSYDGVVFVAGRTLATSRWTSAFKREAWASRVDATRSLCERLAAAAAPPRVYVTASAIGFYGDRGEEVLDESSARGAGFPADLASAWEAASQPLSEAGSRVVRLRFGVVLAREGGALPPLARLTRFGLGGPLGSGRQFWSWISLNDLIAVIVRAVERPELSGSVNVVAPEPLRQRAFARVLGGVLRRPALFPAPAPALRLLLGEKADTLLLASARVVPRRLQETGFPYRHPELEGALRDLLGV